MKALSKVVEENYMNFIRPRLPKKTITYNGVKVKDRAFLDSLLAPNMIHPTPDTFESGLVSILSSEVSEGDHVVIVGGGLGVTTVIAARSVGEEGYVDCFEGAKEKVEQVRKTAELNEVEDRVEVHHKAIESSEHLWGNRGDANIMDSDQLPACDILEMDCEGAEIDIIRKLEIRPRLLAVESHGVFGSPTEEVVDTIEDKGYTIVDTKIAESGGLEKRLKKEDVRVIEAKIDN